MWYTCWIECIAIHDYRATGKRCAHFDIGIKGLKEIRFMIYYFKRARVRFVKGHLSVEPTVNQAPVGVKSHAAKKRRPMYFHNFNRVRRKADVLINLLFLKQTLVGDKYVSRIDG